MDATSVGTDHSHGKTGTGLEIETFTMRTSWISLLLVAACLLEGRWSVLWHKEIQNTKLLL